MTIERIFAATDLSPTGARALHRAAQLARAHRVPLEIATVVPGNWRTQLRGWLAGAAVHGGAPRVAARLQEAAQALRQAHAVEVRAHVLRGDPRLQLARFAAARGGGLLVVGARGRSLLGELALGSTALALLQRSASPLLIVQGDAAHPYRKVLAGVAFEPAARTAIALAAQLAPQAELTLAHAYEEPFAAELFLGQASDDAVEHYRELARRRAQDDLEAFIAGLPIAVPRIERRLLHGSPGLQLARLARELGAELVVLGARRKSRADAALLGSVAANVALMVESDLLLVREPA